MSIAERTHQGVSLLTKTPTLLPGLMLIAVVVLPAIFGGLFYDLDMQNVFAGSPNMPPSQEHPLGTQAEGRDMVALLMVATPATIWIGIIGGSVGLLIGTILGMSSGYFGGRYDTLIRNLVDVGLTIPPLALLIMIAASFNVVEIEMMGLVVASTSWMYPTRVIRSQVLSLRERTFTHIAKLSGVGHFYIIFVELMPNLISVLAASFVNAVSVAILASIGLEVLGLGSQTPTLGRVIYYAIYYAAMWRGLWWWWLPPIIILIAIFMGLFLVSTALDEISNPRLKQAN